MWPPNPLLHRLRLAAFVAVAVVVLAPSVHAQTVTIGWDANTESDLAGYVVQFGTAAGNPTTNVDVGNVTSRQFVGLQLGITYYFRVVAYNTGGQQSGPSNEVPYTVTPPGPPPTLASVSPGSGSTAGGTTITLIGADFAPGASVRVGGTAATGVTFVSAAQLTAIAPAGTPGSKAVSVTNPDTQSATLNNAFTYVAPPPTLSAVSPISGPTAGGTTITLTGTNFVVGATVRVGGTSATGVAFVTATQLRANTPAGTEGVVSVQITNPDTQSATLAGAFTYSASAPTLSSVSPTSGPTAGGTTITLTGTNFVSGATVRVGGNAATGVTFVSATQLRANTPSGTAGSRSVQVTNPDAQSVTLASAFTFVAPAPTLTTVSPGSGSTAGGTTITLTGTNFVSGATVRVGGNAATGVNFVSTTQLRANTPAGTAGAKSVQVINPDTQSATRASAFTYVVPAPTLTSVSPASGSTLGGTSITLRGANFQSGATVRVGGVAATGVTFVSATQLRATTPAAAAGTTSVQVTNPDAQSVTRANGFTYVTPTPSPTLTSVSPTTGSTAGGTTITLTGSNYVSGATVLVGGTAATSVTFLSSSQLRATTPAGPAGLTSVQVLNPDAQSATLNYAFTYVAPPPTLTSVSPTGGSTLGGTTITLSGTNFVSGATVRLGATLATGVTFVSSTQLRATTPPRPAGVVTLQVTNPDGRAVALANAFTYSSSSPAITSVSPRSGPIAGGTVITITGSNFVQGGAGVVRVGGAVAASLTFVNAATLRATTPSGTRGAQEVQVVNPNGVATQLANGFTYTDSTADDVDGDGLPDAWEQQFGLDPSDATGANGAAGDPDGDGVINENELTAGTHPRGFEHKYLAEGAVNSFFNTRLSLANPQALDANVLLTFSDSNGHTTRRFVEVPARSRRTIDVSTVAELQGTSFSTALESDQIVVLDRLMTWDGASYGAHAETAVDSPATTWYLAEGATSGPFELFYLVQNPSAAAAELQIRYLLPGGLAPLTKFYTVDAGSRFTIWVDQEDAALAATDVSAEITSLNNVPIIVERSMYLNTARRPFKGGHNSAAVTAPATRWFLAEGATGNFFSMFVLLANPTSQVATVQATFMRDSGDPVVKTYSVGANSRYTIDVAAQDEALRATAVAVQVDSTNAVPIIVERTMWWPSSVSGWTEGHNAFGTTVTAPRWLLAEGEVGGPRGIQTFVLVANTSAADSTVRLTLFYEDGPEESRDITLGANRRSTLDISAAFPGSMGRRFSVLIESQNPGTAGGLVVERAIYWNTEDEIWGVGSDAVATKLP